MRSETGSQPPGLSPRASPNDVVEAVLVNDTRNVSILVSECGVNVNAPDDDGRIAFLEAAERGTIDITPVPIRDMF